jgi:uncharacterized membrane protein YjdF
MQALVCIGCLVIVIPNIHIYAIIDTQVFPTDETIKIFLVYIINVIISFGTGSSLFLRYFIPTTYFILFYYFAVVYMMGASMLFHAQNLITVWLVILSTSNLLKQYEGDDRRYFALSRMTRHLTVIESIASNANLKLCTMDPKQNATGAILKSQVDVEV